MLWAAIYTNFMALYSFWEHFTIRSHLLTIVNAFAKNEQQFSSIGLDQIFIYLLLDVFDVFAIYLSSILC